MSYRNSHPNPPVWTFQESSNCTQPDPYDRAGAASLSELAAPDGSTTFLVSTTFANFQDSGWPEYFTLYGIEAPRDCPMRRAFEWGESSWRDFWTHKGWLLHMREPFAGGPMVSSYVSTSHLSKYFNETLDDFRTKGPYDFKLQQLELSCMPSPFTSPRELAKAEREYQEFMLRHGHKFARRAA